MKSVRQSEKGLTLVGSLKDVVAYTQAITRHYGGSMKLSDLLAIHELRAGVNGQPIYDDNCDID